MCNLHNDLKRFNKVAYVKKIIESVNEDKEIA